MKGFIPIEIPTKRYIKAYLIARFGEKVFITKEDPVGYKFYDLIKHKTNEDKNDFASVRYNVTVKIYIKSSIFMQHKHCLNETNIKNFNLFIERQIKNDYRLSMDFFMKLFPSFINNLPAVRKKIGIKEDAWSDESIKKDYYRYRKMLTRNKASLS